MEVTSESLLPFGMAKTMSLNPDNGESLGPLHSSLSSFCFLAGEGVVTRGVPPFYSSGLNRLRGGPPFSGELARSSMTYDRIEESFILFGESLFIVTADSSIWLRENARL